MMMIEWKDRRTGDLLEDENGVVWFVPILPHAAVSVSGAFYSGDTSRGTFEVLYRRPDPEPEWPEPIRYPHGTGRAWIYDLNSDVVDGPAHAYSPLDARIVAAGWEQVADWWEWKETQ